RRAARGRTRQSAYPCAETSKKTGARRRPVGYCICGFLEAVRHAHEGPGHARTEYRRVARPGIELVGRHARPGELGVPVVGDLRPLHAEAGALREAVLVTDAPLLGARLTKRNRTVHVLRLGPEALDSAEADRYGEGERILLRYDVAFRAAQRRQVEQVGRAWCKVARRRVERQQFALVLVPLVGCADVDNTEVPATLDRPAGVGFSDRGEILVAVKCGADASAAAHSRPLDGAG